MSAVTKVQVHAAPERLLSLDRLAELPSTALRELYRRCQAPDDLRVLDGRPRGRMLAVRGVEAGRLGALLRRVARHDAFPWDGKSFFPVSATEGRGINRVKLHRGLEWFPFTTRIEPSVVDGAPCVYLDYEQPGNPWLIAKIRDEIRELTPGLFLGPAMWKTQGSAILLLWFAVDFQTPVA